MRYAFVVPRYGVEVVGGAEYGARMLAERLVTQRDWKVEVFTTCALDHMTWANYYPAGDEVVNGVTVHRFPSTGGRPARFFPFSERVLSHAGAATLAESEEFVDLQGPDSPALVDAVASAPCDVLAFYPYLYSTTVRPLQKLEQRRGDGDAPTLIMHPAAHDEPALHLPLYRRTFGEVDGLVFQTLGERALVERILHVGHLPQVVVGLGFEEPPADVDLDVRPACLGAIGERPYVLSLGRVDGFKGSLMLHGFLSAYKQRRPGPLALVMAGPVTAAPPAHPDVVVTGPVDEVDKWRLLQGAQIFVQPSPHEAFSIVLMEAWSRSRPVVVNGRCEATREHCERSGGGLWFESYAQFEAVMDRLVGDPGLRATLGERGRRFVQSKYRWPALIDRYANFAESLVNHRR
ncbi:MAG: glycosyltransferase family 4 protein [Acidimicrobiales bacterium]